MAKDKEVKTNAMRLLDRAKITYSVVSADIPDFVNGVQAADLEGMPHESSFKTLVARGKSGNYHVFMIPIEDEVDLKKAARAAGEKNVELIPVKELLALTGYIRGGCSPIGMKKKFPTYIDESAVTFDKITVSSGTRGAQLLLDRAALLQFVQGKTADLTVK